MEPEQPRSEVPQRAPRTATRGGGKNKLLRNRHRGQGSVAGGIKLDPEQQTSESPQQAPRTATRGGGSNNLLGYRHLDQGSATSGARLEPEPPASGAKTKGSEEEENSQQASFRLQSDVVEVVSQSLGLGANRMIEKKVEKVLKKMIKQGRAKITIATSSVPSPKGNTPTVLSRIDTSVPLNSTHTDEPGQRNVIYLEPVTAQTVLGMTRRFGVPTFMHIHETTGFAHIYFRTHQEAQNCVNELPNAQWMRGFIVTEAMELKEEDVDEMKDLFGIGRNGEED